MIEVVKTEYGVSRKPWDITISSALLDALYEESILLMSITRDFTCAYTSVWQSPVIDNFKTYTHSRS